jgi:hypothetical protein
MPQPKETPSEPMEIRHRSPRRCATEAHGDTPSEPKETRQPGISRNENNLRWGFIRKVCTITDVLPHFLGTHSNDTLAVPP